MNNIFTVVEEVVEGEKKIIVLPNSLAMEMNDAGYCSLVSRGLSLTEALILKSAIENYRRGLSY